MKRYSAKSWYELREDKDGGWVKYYDAREEIKEITILYHLEVEKNIELEKESMWEIGPGVWVPRKRESKNFR